MGIQKYTQSFRSYQKVGTGVKITPDALKKKPSPRIIIKEKRSIDVITRGSKTEIILARFTLFEGYCSKLHVWSRKLRWFR